MGKPGLWPDVFAAITDQARKNGMGVAVHIGQDGVYPMNAARVAADGASTIEHHYGYSESSYTDHVIPRSVAAATCMRPTGTSRASPIYHGIRLSHFRW